MNYNRKDCSPRETIEKIKKILNFFSIKVVEKKMFNINNSFYSVRVELRDFPGIGTNGKGITRDYALASAYGEFMERLQSFFLIKFSFYNKENVKINENNKNSLFSILLKCGYNKNKIKLLENLYIHGNNIMFMDFFSNKKYFFSMEIVNMLTQSNGLCAGNSKCEALVQGICEIFERYSYKYYYFNNKKIPSINLQSIKNANAKSLLNQLDSLNFKYELKDFSINGKYPVVGLLIFNSDKTKYLFSIGADPNFDIALQRCITEIFQGFSLNSINSKMKDISGLDVTNENNYYNWLKSYSSNNGKHPSNFFDSSIIVDYSNLPFKVTTNNIGAFNYLISIIKQEKLMMFISDFSYLGFDTYKVFIPQLSIIDDINNERYIINKNKFLLRRFYFNPFQLSNMDISINNISFFNILIKNKIYSNFISISKIVNTYKFESKYFKISNFYFIVLLLIKSNQYSLLKDIINERLASVTSVIEYNYLTCIINKIDKKPNKLNKLNKDLIKDIDFLFENIDKYLYSILAPNCPNCYACSIRKKCGYKKWKKFIDLLSTKYSEYISR